MSAQTQPAAPREDAPLGVLVGVDGSEQSVSAARWAAKLNADWTYVEMPGVGHVPMIEVPDDTYDAITDWARTQLRDTLD